MRLAVAFGTLALAAGGLTVTVLPRPAFPGPVVAASGPHQLVLVSARYAGVSGLTSWTTWLGRFQGLLPVNGFRTANREFALYGTDASTAHYLVAADTSGHKLYAFDFKNYAWPPRTKPGDREFVYEQPVWAQEAGGRLYVETAHSTYAYSSYGRNGYITAIDLKTKRAVWRSPALVGNADTFLVSGRYLITGYGFTDEPDYLCLLDRATGKLVDRLGLPNAPEKITWHGNLIRVRTYDHVVTVRLRGG